MHSALNSAHIPFSSTGKEGWRCRHIHFKISCKGYKPLTTQMYFYGDPLIEQDIVIAKVPAKDQHLLISKPGRDVSTILPLYQFNILLSDISLT